MSNYQTPAAKNPESLDELLAMMMAEEGDRHPILGDWTDLPTFGGSEPENGQLIWSWDDTRVIVGTCQSDLTIELREE